MDTDFQFLDPILDRLHELVQSFIRHTPEVVAGLLLFGAFLALAVFAARAVPKWKRLTSVRPSVRTLYGKLVAIVLVTVGTICAAVVVFPDITPGRLFTMLGVGSIAIGFALKDVLENLMAGMILLGRKTIAIGDVIDCDGTQGAVDVITVRDTYLRTPWGERIVVPNGHLFRHPVKILTWPDARRVRSRVSVAYGTDLDRACEVIESEMAGLPSVDGDRSVEALVHEFGDSGIDLDLLWWTDSAPLDVLRSKSEVHRAVKRALDREGIEIPFPQRVLHVSGDLAGAASDEPRTSSADTPEEAAETASENV